MLFFQLFIFGSFSEDETKLLQSPETKNSVLTEELPYLQFGSFSLSSIKTSRDLNAVEKKSNTLTTPKECTKKEKHANGIPSINHELGTISVSHSSESTAGSPLSVKSIGVKEIVIEAEYQKKFHEKSDNGVATLERNNSEAEVSVDLTRVSASKVDFDGRLKKAIESNGLVPRGLINSGNLCFRNATLQALLSCSPFVRLFEDLRTRNIPKVLNFIPLHLDHFIYVFIY